MFSEWFTLSPTVHHSSARNALQSFGKGCVQTIVIIKHIHPLDYINVLLLYITVGFIFFFSSDQLKHYNVNVTR